VPDVCTSEWYDAIREAMNASAATLRNLPEGSFVVAIEIVGDGRSPYVPEGEERRFLARMTGADAPGTARSPRPATRRPRRDGRSTTASGARRRRHAIAAGLADPIEAALRGLVRVRGDVRFLLRHAEHAKALLDAYTSRVETTWPRGRPPYEASSRPPTGGASRGEETRADEEGRARA
jgi:hypothetical protein